jgi:4,5-dihydroxyphthalate decarboxylase
MRTGTLTLTAAVSPRGGSKPLLDGEIALHGLTLQQIAVEPQIAAYRRMVRGLEFDICELAPTTYLCAKAFDKQFTAIPVSLSRGFHHHSIVCNAASNIHQPKDLEGKKFGVRAYTVTTGVWARGILQSEYDVDPFKISWYTDDEEHVLEWQPPANVVKVLEGDSLVEMMAAGKLDAALSGAAGIGRSGPPTANWEAAAEQPAAAPSVTQVPLFANAADLEAEWYRRTRIYPIHGIIAIKNSVLQQYPWVAPELLRAFQASKEFHLKRLDKEGPRSADDRGLLDARKLIGENDPLPFGLSANRPTFEALIDYAFQQKIIPTRVTPESVLAANAVEV